MVTTEGNSLAMCWGAAYKAVDNAYPNPGSLTARYKIKSHIETALKEHSMNVVPLLEVLTSSTEELPDETQGSIWKALCTTVILYDITGKMKEIPSVIAALINQLEEEKA